MQKAQAELASAHHQRDAFDHRAHQLEHLLDSLNAASSPAGASGSLALLDTDLPANMQKDPSDNNSTPDDAFNARLTAWKAHLQHLQGLPAVVQTLEARTCPFCQPRALAWLHTTFLKALVLLERLLIL